MQIYGPSGIHQAQNVSGPHNNRRVDGPQNTTSSQSADSVEISSGASFVDQVHQLPDIRQDRVTAIRQQIANGTYETPDKLDAAMSNLLNEIG